MPHAKTNPPSQVAVSIAVWILLCVLGLLILSPKLVLIKFTNDTLWGDIGWANLIGAIAQDALLAIVIVGTAAYALQTPNWKRVIVAATATGGVLLSLLLDMRVRQVWLKPMDISLILFGVENASGLMTGSDLFFNYGAGLGMTFRRLLAFAGAAHIALWLSIAMLVLGAARPHPGLGSGLKIRQTMHALVFTACIFFSVALISDGYRYRMNENLFVGTLVNWCRLMFVPLEYDHDAVLAAGFEQKSEPLSHQLRAERTILRDSKRFENVVVVFLESVRWRGLHLSDPSKTKMPNLARLAANGFVSKSYVSVPHSSKAYFSVLSGRHPYPAIEMREAARQQHESIFHFFSKERNGSIFAFSSFYFGFENMGGLLKSLGVEHRLQTADLAAAIGARVNKATSYGSSDELLYVLGSQHLTQARRPFVATFFPMAAHYPYDCGQASTNGLVGAFEHLRSGNGTIKDYDICLRSADELIAVMMREFGRLNLLTETLFVFVGDHGESFGEHGLFVHNSSMYEEEVAVPLVFWSDGGQLATDTLLVSRQIDIAPTIADFLGIMDVQVPVQGVSLLRRTGQAPATFIATFFEGVAQALVEGSMKYIWEPATDRLIAFDLDADPDEVLPRVVAGEEKQAIVRRLQAFQAYQKSQFPD